MDREIKSVDILPGHPSIYTEFETTTAVSNLGSSLHRSHDTVRKTHRIVVDHSTNTVRWSIRHADESEDVILLSDMPIFETFVKNYRKLALDLPDFEIGDLVQVIGSSLGMPNMLVTGVSHITGVSTLWYDAVGRSFVRDRFPAELLVLVKSAAQLRRHLNPKEPKDGK